MTATSTKSRPYPTAMFSKQKLIPRDPTPSMEAAGLVASSSSDMDRDEIRAIWRAMFDEATA